MCTSFVYRGNDRIIAMNYDNHGMNLRLASAGERLFLLTASFQGVELPLFGLRSDGLFANQQVVNPCDAPPPADESRTANTTEAVAAILRLPKDEIGAYLQTHEIVNPPGYEHSLHMMIADPRGTSYIVEPGRGVLVYPPEERYFVMSNCSLCDARRTGEWAGFGVDRQQTAERLLASADERFSVTNAIEALDAVHSTDETWHTEFSFVYSENESAVYYCYQHDYAHMERCALARA